MDTLEAILARRSIRKFKREPIPDSVIERVLKAGIAAPSGQNRQPWQFYVLTGQGIEDLAAAVELWAGARGRRSRFRTGAEHLLPALRSAAAAILVYDRMRIPLGQKVLLSLRPDLTRILDRMDTQSIGAAIENMALAGTHLGLGTLWVNYILFAAKEIDDLLDERGAAAPRGSLVAGLLIGAPDETPGPRARRSLEDSATWLR